MANTIILKRSSVAAKVPLATDLQVGELAINLADQKLFSKNASGTVIEIGGAVSSVAGKTGAVTLVKGDVGLGSVDNTADAAKNVLSASKWTTARTLSLTGDATGSMSVDGSANASAALTLANSGVTAGTYKSVTVDAKGRVTAGTNPTTLAGYGITDAVTAGAGGAIFENTQTISANYTLTSGKNGLSAGPITIASGITVTVPSGSVWAIV